MKRPRNGPPPPVDLAAARARAGKQEQSRDRAAAWLAQVRATARRFLAAGDTPTIEVARLLRELGSSAAANAVAAALSTAEEEELEFEQWRDLLRPNSNPLLRDYLESLAVAGDRAARRALEE